MLGKWNDMKGCILCTQAQFSHAGSCIMKYPFHLLIISTSTLVTKVPDEKNYATEPPKPDNQTSIETESKESASGISILALTLISGSLAVLLVLAMLCLLWRRYPPRKRHGRYKSFLPMSLQSDGGIAIPTIGLPRGNKAEAEILIPEDEDDEI